MLLAMTVLILVAIYFFTEWWRAKVKIQKFKYRLEQKDRIISTMVRALPILFVENYKDPNIHKEHDGSFMFYTQTRLEYDGRFMEIEWVCQGNRKNEYNSLMLRYFKYLDLLGVNVHPVLLGDRPYSGRVMTESFADLDKDEIQTTEESVNSVRKIRNVRDGDDIPVC